MQTAESKLHSHWWWEGLTIPNAWGAGSTQRCSRKAHYPPPKSAGEASVPRAQVSGARLSQDAVAGMHRGGGEMDGEVPHQQEGKDWCRKNRGKAAVHNAEAVAVAVI